ncbi:hypothetical protein MF271_07135 [Deinococcus sp. KNUC1210]|uniref:hypothetical protein n=1 Tax=Deinococcus sp. KNUC1210 TaxID=2917691 RepID=UPI001EF09E46|nr:hypothetical protein [Deinococcus sp. KNUC1210]ULH16358.1 hypothetical protein MF271_07135 [Deinococcus sp. KNUC1210]
MTWSLFVRTFILRSIRNRLWWVTLCVALVLVFLQLLASSWMLTALGGLLTLAVLLAFISFNSYQRHRDEV